MLRYVVQAIVFRVSRLIRTWRPEAVSYDHAHWDAARREWVAHVDKLDRAA